MALEDRETLAAWSQLQSLMRGTNAEQEKGVRLTRDWKSEVKGLLGAMSGATTALRATSQKMLGIGGARVQLGGTNSTNTTARELPYMGGSPAAKTPTASPVKAWSGSTVPLHGGAASIGSPQPTTGQQALFPVVNSPTQITQPIRATPAPNPTTPFGGGSAGGGGGGGQQLALWGPGSPGGGGGGGGGGFPGGLSGGLTAGAAGIVAVDKIVKGIVNASGRIQGLLPDAATSVDRQRALFQSQRISGGSTSASAINDLGRAYIGPGMAYPNDDVRVTQTIDRLLPRDMWGQVQGMAQFNQLANNINPTVTAQGVAGLYSGQTSNALFRQGLFTTGLDGKKNKNVVQDMYRLYNVGSFKSIEDMNTSLYSGTLGINLANAGITGQSLEVVSQQFRDMWQANDMGVPLDMNPETMVDSEYANKAGWNDETQNPNMSQGTSAEAGTRAYDEARTGQMGSYNATNSAMEFYYDKLATGIEKLGPAGDAIIATSGAIKNIYAFLRDRFGGGVGGGDNFNPTSGGGIGGGPNFKAAGTSAATAAGIVSAALASAPKPKSASPTSVGGGTSSSVKAAATASTATKSSATTSTAKSATAAAAYTPFSASYTPSGSSTGSLGQSTSSTSSSTSDSSSKTDAGPIGDIDDSSPNEVKKTLALQLAGLGLTVEQIAGVLGNIANESSFDPKADNGSHRGLAQWGKGQGERWSALEKYAKAQGLEPDSAEAQIGFILREMKSGWGDFSLKEFRGTKSVDAAADYFNRYYEVSDQGSDVRAASGKDMLPQIKKWVNNNGNQGYSQGAWTVRGDQTTRVHEDEMILPAQFANAVRDALSGAGGGGVVNVNVTLMNSGQAEANRLVKYVASEIDKKFRLTALAEA